MKRVMILLAVAVSIMGTGCTDPSSDLVAKINAAYHTRFYVADQNDMSTAPSQH
jgi:hypothetical protein